MGLMNQAQSMFSNKEVIVGFSDNEKLTGQIVNFQFTDSFVLAVGSKNYLVNLSNVRYIAPAS
jgi:hypothetical protein